MEQLGTHHMIVIIMAMIIYDPSRFITHWMAGYMRLQVKMVVLK